jgi:hypothetical protein
MNVPMSSTALPKPATINRRLALFGAAAVSVAVVVPVVAVAASPQMTAEDRYAFHLAGLQAAVRELKPDVTAWSVSRAGWGFGADFLMVGTTDEHLSWGDALGGCFPTGNFKHDRLGSVPTIEMADYCTADERYAAMTEREDTYRRWLGMEVFK